MTPPVFRVNPECEKQIVFLGEERNPVLILDNFLAAPEELRQAAGAGEPFLPQNTDLYPGIRKAAPEGYRQALETALLAVIGKVFSASSSPHVTVDVSAYSLATTPEHKLRPIQCVPHIDTEDATHLAAVHYLCDENYGGTSFYRHRSSGYESITVERVKDYFEKLKLEVAQEGMLGRHYINGDTRLFQRIANIPLKFNRLILYRGNCLHAGNINPADGLRPSPQSGRLTVNSFLRVHA
jgi:hypothetical protein